MYLSVVDRRREEENQVEETEAAADLTYALK
jgi:hypothetical protein